MSLFNDYESELQETFTLIRNKIPEWQQTKKQTTAGQVESEFEIARDTLDNMNQIVQSTHNAEALRSKVKSHESTFQNLREQWERARLLTDPNRQQFKDGMVTLKKTSERIAEIDRIAAESEEIGSKTVGRLKDDNAKLEGAYDEMMEMGGNITTSRSILGRMTRRAIYSKLILSVIIIVQILAIVIIIGVKWIYPIFKKYSPTEGPTTFPTSLPTVSPTTFSPT